MQEQFNKAVHLPVMVREVINNWLSDKSGFYVDCTFGIGGHTKELLKNLSKDAKIIGIDLDVISEEEAKKLENSDERFKFVKLNFVNFFDYWKKENLPQINGILFDLGYSTAQLNDAERGFGYSNAKNLNMVVDINNKKTAAYILNTYSKKELFDVFKKYGDFKNPKKLVDFISAYRKEHDISTIDDCLKIIESVFPTQQFQFNKNPAKLFFQSLRIEANNEIENLRSSLEYLDKILLPNGHALFLTFNSLEEQVIKKWSEKNCSIIVLPDYGHNIESKFKLIENLYPEKEEIMKNWSARSSKLWVFKKIK